MAGILSAVELASDAKNLADRIEQVFQNMFGERSRFDRWPDLAAELWRISRTQNW
jgi:hypothetical protein